jgi:Icc-related predicted phosphoesterase
VRLFRRGGNREKGKRKFNRVFFATDLHGSDDCFRKFVKAADHYEADILVLGGDITGKIVLPIVRQSDGSWRVDFMGEERRFQTEEELQQFDKVLRRMGGYAYHTDADELAELEGADDRERRVDDVALRLMLERVEEWVRYAEERLGGTEVKVLMGGGNDDPYEVDDVIKRSDFVVNHDNRVIQLDEHHEILSLGYANITPWHCPRDIPDEDIGGKIDALIGEVQDMRNCIFCIHVPPVDSSLDTCPLLDDSEYPPKMVRSPGGEVVLYGAGSQSVREAIERYQPLAGLHGHIHESRGVADLGRTKVFNPGSEYSEGVLRGVIVNLTSDGLLSYQFTSG